MNPKLNLTLTKVLNLFFKNWNIQVVKNDHIIKQGSLDEIKEHTFVVSGTEFNKSAIIDILPGCYENSVFIIIE